MTTLAIHPLLMEIPLGKAPDPDLLRELRQLAYSTDSLPARTRVLFQSLRKVFGRQRATDVLYGVQYLAQANEPAGARLLAAALDANTPGTRLVPRINAFSNTRRLQEQMQSESEDSRFMRKWEKRLQDLRRTCQELEEELPEHRFNSKAFVEDEPQFLILRRILNHLVATLYRHGDLAAADSTLLADLATLEVDAYQERVSRLAGLVDPYRSRTVARVLPLLSQADAEIADLREFITWVENGQVEIAFHHRVPRSYEVLDPMERQAYLRQVKECASLKPLSRLLSGLQNNAIPVPQLADIAARLLALGHQLHLAEVRASELDLVTAVSLAQTYDREGELRLPLSSDLERVLDDLLRHPIESDDVRGEWPLVGFSVADGTLVMRSPRSGSGRRIWRDDLPAVPQGEVEEKSAGERVLEVENVRSEEGVTAIKQLVMSNIGSVSMVTGFLRNPKITAVPGLVGSITARTRSLQVLNFIASNRTLYSGFANKDVPRLLLASPCNIPVKTLRRFIHVKFVSKVDLKRMSQDKTGIRGEVTDEIVAYLRSLS